MHAVTYTLFGFPLSFDIHDQLQSWFAFQCMLDHWSRLWWWQEYCCREHAATQTMENIHSHNAWRDEEILYEAEIGMIFVRQLLGQETAKLGKKVDDLTLPWTVLRITAEKCLTENSSRVMTADLIVTQLKQLLENFHPAAYWDDDLENNAVSMKVQLVGWLRVASYLYKMHAHLHMVLP